MSRGLVVIVLGLLLAACGGSVPPTSPAPTADPSVLPSVRPGTIQLDRVPDGFGCDAIGVPYRQVTFRVQAGPDGRVTAVTETGAVLRTAWSPAFTAGDADDPVVRDADGQVVAADGDVLVLPNAGWPRLHGYFVCPGIDAVTVLDQDPA